MNSMNGLLEESRDARLFQKPNFTCASRTQNRAVELTYVEAELNVAGWNKV
ncbi:MAG TPA: hypothetical protein V6C78_25480 [Crinalium sp.]